MRFIWDKITGGWQTVLSFLYPAFCAECGRLVVVADVFCISCYRGIPSVPLLNVALSAQRALVIHAISAYVGSVAHLVRQKERRDIFSAHQLGRLAVRYCQEKDLCYDVVLAVPAHWTRFLARGYNQSAVIAKHLEAAGYARWLAPFMRKRATAYQKSLAARERQKNLRHAFGVSLFWSSTAIVRMLEGKRVLIVDDVYTTGATLQEFARLVARYKPQNIEVLVSCRVL